MLLVIFGAGASFDIAPGRRGTPLAKDLVDRAYDRTAASLPASRPIIARLRERFAAAPEAFSLESELADLVEDSYNSPHRRQQLVAFRFYLQRVILACVEASARSNAGFTNYLTLMNYLYDWQRRTGQPIRLATFNYDTMLDVACQDVLPDWQLSDLSSYIERDDFRLFKLHGSIGWCRATHIATTVGVSGDMVVTALANADQTLDAGEIRPHPPAQAAVGGHVDITIPALAIPMADKTSFECPEEHVEALRAEIGEVKAVLMIGWRAAEEHAVELLNGLLPSYARGLVTASEDDQAEVVRNLGHVAARGRPLLSVTGDTAFTDLARDVSGQLDGFLGGIWD